MCGRYAAILPADHIAALFQTIGPLPDWAGTWNMAPTRDAPVIRLHPETGQRHLGLLRWGLVPHWVKDPKTTRQPINARGETIASTPMFRDAFARRRCLVPADAFYEWQAAPEGKLPWAIARADAACLVFAGLWEGWRGPDGTVIRSFTIVTTSANAALRPLHERMPVVLETPGLAALARRGRRQPGQPAAPFGGRIPDLAGWHGGEQRPPRRGLAAGPSLTIPVSFTCRAR